jgi:hypothetical protein
MRHRRVRLFINSTAWLPLGSIAIGLLVAILLLPGSTARAGGSWLDAYRESYRPGETVVMRGGVSRGQLGWVDDGPFYAYLQKVTDQPMPLADDAGIYLGALDIREVGDDRLEVSITFVLPEDIPAGQYWVAYCNDPCTEGLGDLVGGGVTVVARGWSYRPSSGFVFPI